MSIQNEVESVWEMSEDQLLANLGLADIATKDNAAALKSYDKVVSLLNNQDKTMTHQDAFEWIRENGIEAFKRIWKTIKESVCQIYHENTSVEDDKGLAVYLSGIVVATLGITNALAVLVITIAVKRGLDNMCPVES